MVALRQLDQELLSFFQSCCRTHSGRSDLILQQTNQEEDLRVMEENGEERDERKEEELV